MFSWKTCDPLFKFFCLVGLVCIILAVLVFFVFVGSAQEATKPTTTPTTTPTTIAAATTTTIPKMVLERSEFLEFKLLVAERDKLDAELKSITAQLSSLTYAQRDTEKALRDSQEAANARWSETCKKLGVDPKKYTVVLATGEVIPIPAQRPPQP